MFPIFFLSQVWVWTCMQWFVDYTSIQESKCGVWCHCLLSVTLLLGLINPSRVASSTPGSVGVCLGLHFDFSTVNLFPHNGWFLTQNLCIQVPRSRVMLLIITMLHKLTVNEHYPTQVPTTLLSIIKSTNVTEVIAEKMDHIPAI